MATSTVPAIASGPTGLLLTSFWIDDNEKEYSSSFQIKSGATDPELQALVDGSQPGSNASLWKVELTSQFEGAKDSGNATSAVHESVADKVRYSMKAIATKSYTHAYMPAPIEAWVGDNGIVDITQATYIAWKAAVDALKLALFTPLNVAFVEYSQRNDSTSP